jgi:triosephosphate isomerase (TIM)
MKYVIANWKMNKNLSDILMWAEEFKKNSRKLSPEIKLIAAPSFPHLTLANELLKPLSIDVCAQTLSEKEMGAHTGEVGAFQLKELVKYCIIGHSELKEPFDLVSKKRDMCLAKGITPILCFFMPSDAPKYYKPGTILAWEDPNNISISGVYKKTNFEVITDTFGFFESSLPKEATVLYGGSVNRDNAEELSRISGVKGFLIGNASLDALHFLDIASYMDSA